MKKIFSIFAACLFAVSMYAVKFTASDFKGKGTADTGSDVSLTKDGVTVSATRAYGSDTSLRIYGANPDNNIEGGVLTITADKKIVKIQAEFDKNTKMTFETQEPNANSWSITAAKQIRITTLIVTREGETEEIIEPAKNLGEKTIEEFLSLKNDKDTCVLTGVVDNIVMDKDDATKYNKYGNFDLVGINGDKGKVYIYGLLTAAGEAQKFREMDVDKGDTVTLKAIYTEYKGSPQAVNAIYVSHKNAAGGGSGEGGEEADKVYTYKYAEAYNYYDYYGEGAENIVIYLYNDEESEEYAQIDLLVAEGTGEGDNVLKAGTYPMSLNFDVPSALYGDADDEGNPIGCWVFGATAAEEYPLADGKVEISVKDKVYTIKMTSIDGSAEKDAITIEVNYTGAIVVEEGEIEPEGVENVNAESARPVKVMHNGQLYIIREGKMYNMVGASVK